MIAGALKKMWLRSSLWKHEAREYLRRYCAQNAVWQRDGRSASRWVGLRSLVLTGFSWPAHASNLGTLRSLTVCHVYPNLELSIVESLEHTARYRSPAWHLQSRIQELSEIRCVAQHRNNPACIQ